MAIVAQLVESRQVGMTLFVAGSNKNKINMAIVAQLVERRTVTPFVAGSIPVDRPILKNYRKFVVPMNRDRSPHFKKYFSLMI